MNKLKLLNNPEVIRWCYTGITPATLITTSNKTLLTNSRNMEKEWANNLLRKYYGYDKKIEIKQWTTKLGEEIVREVLTLMNIKLYNQRNSYKSSLSNKTYEPDLECDKYLYEVKARNWTTQGTAGEKILGVPMKYSELPHLSGKPIKIILVGFQEEEAKTGFGFGNLLCSSNCNPIASQIINCYKNLGFEYVGLTTLLNQLGFNST